MRKFLSWVLLLCMLLTLAPVSAFAEGAIIEEAPVGADAPGGPSDEPAEPAGEELAPPADPEEPAEPVRVLFACDPAELTLTVYTLDAYNEKQIIEPEEDGSYLLLPGVYFYDAACEGYKTVEKAEVLVEATVEPLRVELTLAPAETYLEISEEEYAEALEEITEEQAPETVSEEAADETARMAAGQLILGQEMTVRTVDSNYDNHYGVYYLFVPKVSGVYTLSGCGEYVRNRYGSEVKPIEDPLSSFYLEAFEEYFFTFFNWYDDKTTATVLLTLDSAEYDITSVDVHSFADLKAAVARYDGQATYVFYNETAPFVFEESMTLPEYLYFCADADNSTVIIPRGVTLSVQSTATGAFYAENLVVNGRMSARRDAVYYRNLTGEVNWLVSVLASGACGDNHTWVLDQDGILTISGTGDMSFSSSQAPWHAYNGDIEHAVIEPGVTSIDSHAFEDCYYLLSVDIPASVKRIGNSAFQNCDDLTEIVIPYGVTKIESMTFYDCSELQYVTIPDSVTGIDYRAFYNCYKLYTIEIPDSVTWFGEYAFASSGLRSIKLPAGLTMIREGLFYWSDLSSIEIPESVKTIEEYAFCRCLSLYSISLPSGLATIESNAFVNCYGTNVDIYFNGFEALKNSRMEYGNWSEYGNDYLITARWHYVDTHPGWQKIGNNWFNFKDDGKTPKTGWLKSAGSWYYLNEHGVMQTGWTKVDGKWYYMSASGVMQTGWQKIGKTWYFLEAGGAMVTGWKKLSGKWYYFQSSGAMVTGIQKIGSTVYYFESSGAMYEKAGWKQISGKWYYFNASGAAKKGWYQESGKWYFFLDDGSMTTGWTKIGDELYHFYGSGAMNTSIGWQQIDGKWYYLDENSAAWRGWYTVWKGNDDYSNYYLDYDTGVMATGWKQIWGDWYYFSSSGVMQTGWVKSGGKWYYMDEYGVMVVNASKNIGGKRYYFDENGVCQNP